MNRMYKKIFVYIFLLCLLIFVTCERNATPPPTEPLDNNQKKLIAKTDTTVYLLSGNIVQARFTILNRTDSTAYFSHCGELIVYMLQKKENNVWQDKSGWGFPCLAIYSMGIKQLQPDSSYFNFVNLKHVGTYRLLFPFGWFVSTTSLTDSLYSNEFHVQ